VNLPQGLTKNKQNAPLAGSEPLITGPPHAPFSKLLTS